MQVITCDNLKGRVKKSSLLHLLSAEDGANNIIGGQRKKKKVLKKEEDNMRIFENDGEKKDNTSKLAKTFS